MVGSLRALLTGALDCGDASRPGFTAFCAFKSGQHGWLAGRYVVPAPRLESLPADFPGKVELAIVGTGGATLETWETNLEADARAMTAFESLGQETFEIAAYETRPPSGELASCLKHLRGFSGVELFVEVEPADVATLAEAGEFCAKFALEGRNSQDLAVFLQQCAQAQTPFKLCGGSASAEVLGAFALALEHDLTASEINRAFAGPINWTDRSVRWDEFEASISTLDEARQLFSGWTAPSISEAARRLCVQGA